MTDSGGANEHIQTCRRRSGLLTALRPRVGRVMGRLSDRQEIKIRRRVPGGEERQNAVVSPGTSCSI
jgi:hypothetical protein